MSDKRRVHKPYKALRDVHLESLLLVSNVIIGGGRLEFDENDHGGGIVEVSNEDSATLDGLVFVDYILDLTELDTLTTKLDWRSFRPQ